LEGARTRDVTLLNNNFQKLNNIVETDNVFNRAKLTECNNLINSDVPDRSQFRDIHPNTQTYVKDLYKKLDISPRTEVKILLVAQTIADLNDSTRITRKHINKAVDLMGLANSFFRDFK